METPARQQAKQVAHAKRVMSLRQRKQERKEKKVLDKSSEGATPPVITVIHPQDKAVSKRDTEAVPQYLDEFLSRSKKAYSANPRNRSDRVETTEKSETIPEVIVDEAISTKTSARVQSESSRASSQSCRKGSTVTRCDPRLSERSSSKDQALSTPVQRDRARQIEDMQTEKAIEAEAKEEDFLSPRAEFLRRKMKAMTPRPPPDTIPRTASASFSEGYQRHRAIVAKQKLNIPGEKIIQMLSTEHVSTTDIEGDVETHRATETFTDGDEGTADDVPAHIPLRMVSSASAASSGIGKAQFEPEEIYVPQVTNDLLHKRTISAAMMRLDSRSLLLSKHGSMESFVRLSPGLSPAISSDNLTNNYSRMPEPVMGTSSAGKRYKKKHRAGR
jgi:hypothetical protein